MIRLSSLVEAFLASIAKVRARKTIEHYTRYLRRFVGLVGDIEADQVRRLDILTHCQAWHELQSVKRLFRWASIEAEILPRDPAASIPLSRLGNRQRTPSRIEAARILRAADPCFRAVLIALRETWARPQEVRALAWRQLRQVEAAAAAAAGAAFCFVLVEYKARRRRLDPSRPRIILVSPRLARLLDRLRRRDRGRGGLVFVNSKGQAWTHNAIRCRMRRLRKRIGLERDDRGENVVAYSFRHAGATAAAAAGIGALVLAEVLGHTNVRTTQRYLHFRPEELTAALMPLWSKERKRASIEAAAGG